MRLLRDSRTHELPPGRHIAEKPPNLHCCAGRAACFANILNAPAIDDYFRAGRIARQPGAKGEIGNRRYCRKRSPGVSVPIFSMSSASVAGCMPFNGKALSRLVPQPLSGSQDATAGRSLDLHLCCACVKRVLHQLFRTKPPLNSLAGCDLVDDRVRQQSDGTFTHETSCNSA